MENAKYFFNNLSNRFLEFAPNIIKFVEKLNNNSMAGFIGYQLFRSATSNGANYEEACAAESRADLIHKMQIVLKELRESIYWLNLLEKSNLNIKNDSALFLIMKEAKDLSKITAKSVITVRKK